MLFYNNLNYKKYIRKNIIAIQDSEFNIEKNICMTKHLFFSSFLRELGLMSFQGFLRHRINIIKSHKYNLGCQFVFYCYFYYNSHSLQNNLPIALKTPKKAQFIPDQMDPVWHVVGDPFFILYSVIII